MVATVGSGRGARGACPQPLRRGEGERTRARIGSFGKPALIGGCTGSLSQRAVAAASGATAWYGENRPAARSGENLGSYQLQQVSSLAPSEQRAKATPIDPRAD